MVPTMTKRRDFLQISAATLSSAWLGGCASSLGALAPEQAYRQGIEAGQRQAVEVFDKPLLRALALGLNAPSPHNTQPWLFDIASESEAYLRVDRPRLLPQTDPPARQIHIGCGCFIEAFILGASTLGKRGEVELFPEGTYSSPKDIGVLPVARLRLVGKRASAHPLARYIFNRQTSRLAYSGAWLTKHEFTRVLADADIRSSKARLVTSRKLPPYLKLLDRAMTTEFRTVATNEETRQWFRFSADEATQKRDGLTFETNGITGLSATFARWFTEDTRDSWNSESTIEKGLESFRKALYSARGLILLSTETNTAQDQLQAGRDCYRLMLALTKHDLFCHPLTQVTQEYAAMKPHRKAFEKLSRTRAPAKVQMIMRVGRSAPPELSYRRRLASFISNRTRRRS